MEFQASMTKVIQVTNIAPQATRDQMHTLFSFLGKIEDLRLYPSLRDASVQIQSRCCFVKFLEDGVLPISLHMTNTVFIDRAIIVQSFHGNDIPDELAGLEFANQAARTITGENRLPPHVSNETSVDGMIYTKDMPLYMTGLPPFPPLPGNTEAKVVEEIRRTLVVMNIAPETTAQDVMQYFGNGAGEVKYFRWCTRDAPPAPPPAEPAEGEEAEKPPEAEGRDALLEFTDYGAVIPAMRLNNSVLGENEIKVYYSTQPITKPKAKSNEDSLKEIEEAMKKVKEAQSLVSATVDPLMGLIGRKDRSRSRERSTHDRDYYASSMGPGGTRGRGGRSRSRDRYRRRSRSRDRYRRRSRSRDRRRSRSRESRRKRSRSRRRSRSRKRSRSKSKDKKKEKDVKKKDSKNGDGDEKEVKKEDENGEKAKSRSRSRSKSKKKKSRSRSRSKKRSKRSRSREKKKKSRSRSRSKDHKKKAKKEKRSRSKETKKEVKRDYDQEEKESQEQGGKKEKTESVDMEISNSP